jgi:lipopolysaccharide transport system permease protein
VNELIIEPGRAEKNYWRDLWRYRELFYILAWRDISVRYKQTVIGVAWALIQPLLTILIMTVIFGKVAKLPADGNTPYSIMVFAAMLPWMFFSSSLSSASQSLVGNANLISKVYSACTCLRLGSAAPSFASALATRLSPSTRSTPWSVSLTASAGRSWVGTRRFTGRGSAFP